MIVQLSGICENCSATYSVVLHQSALHGKCPECENKPLKVRRFEGVIYVVKNDLLDGVKVGLTTKPIEQRLRSLSSTGVPGKFRAIALFPTNKLKDKEKKAHLKLSKNRIDKEHFNVDPVTACHAVYTALNRAVKPIFFDDSIRGEFELRLEESRNEILRRLGGGSGTI